MEKLTYLLQSKPLQLLDTNPTVSGVVSSGNLEVLIHANQKPHLCSFTINTSAQGFGIVWEKVLIEFSSRYAVGGTNILINDMGATPAVVMLRLNQAITEYIGENTYE